MIAQLAVPVRLLLLAFALTASAAPASAQQQQRTPSPAAIAIARDIIIAKGADHVYGSLVPGMIERAKGALLQTNPTIGRDLNEVAARLVTEYTPRTAEYMNEAAKVYASYFTDQELKDILAFCKSPAGKKMIELEPGIFQASMTMMQGVADKFGEEMIGRFRVEMKKKGHDL